MSGATTGKPAADSASIWWRHEYQDSGKPWHNTTNGPVPCSAMCIRMPLVSMMRCATSVMAASLSGVHVLQKMQHVGVELLWILQEGEVADRRLQQQSGVWDVGGHELGVFPFDRLIVVAIDDPGRHGDRLQLLGGPVRLRGPH